MSKLLILLLTAGGLFAAESGAMTAMDAFRQAFLKKDMPALSKLVTDDLVYTHSDGKTQNKAEFLKAVVDGPNYVRFDMTEPIVHVHGNTTVVRVTIDLRNATAADRPAPLSVLHVWIKGSQGWQLAARQGTRLPPPATK